jgi:uncharacterized membrane protein
MQIEEAVKMVVSLGVVVPHWKGSPERELTAQDVPPEPASD